MNLESIQFDCKNVSTFCSDLSIEESVFFTGKRNDVPVVMNVFDIFALTSIYEGFGLVLLEAMACGKPIVATNVSAIPEVVSEGHNALLFEKQNEHQLSEMLEKVVSPDLRKDFSRASLVLAK